MIESFSEFLKKSDSRNLFESNEAEGQLDPKYIPTESIETGGSLDKEFWDNYYEDENTDFKKPRFISDDKYLVKITNIVIKHIRKNFEADWTVYPYIFDADGNDATMVYNKKNDIYLVLTKIGMEKKIGLFTENPLNISIKPTFSVSTNKLGFLSMIYTLVNTIKLMDGKSDIIIEAKEPAPAEEGEEASGTKALKARPTKSILMPGEVSIRTDGSPKVIVGKIMGPEIGSSGRRDESYELNREDVVKYLELFEKYDDSSISKYMTSEPFEEGSPFKTVQDAIYYTSKGELDPTNAGRVTGVVHCILCGFDEGFNMASRKIMRDCWFWEGGKSGKLSVYLDSRDHLWKVMESESKIELEVKKLDSRLEREKKFMKAMLNYVKKGGEGGTAEKLRGIMSSHRGLMVTGMGGIGKTVAVNQAIAETNARENIDYIKLNSVGTAQTVYKNLYKYNDMVIIYDDTNSLWEDQDKVSLLKQATSSDESSRQIDTPSAKGLTAGSTAGSLGSEYYNVIGGKVDRHQRYYLEVGSISDYDRKVWIDNKVREMGRNESAKKARYEDYIPRSESELRSLAAKQFEEYAEERQQEHFPNRFTFNGFIVFLTNETISNFMNSRIVGPHWGGLSRRISIIDISPRPNVVWEWLKIRIKRDIENDSLSDDCRVLPREGKAENSNIENVMQYMEEIMAGKYDTDTEKYGKISFATITSLRDYISSSENTEQDWKELILDDMLQDSEREQS